MVEVNLHYGNKISFSYTDLFGNENIKILEQHWLKSIALKRKLRVSFSLKFPFVELKRQHYSDIVLNVGTELYPSIKHIAALESPRLIAKRFGIYGTPDTNLEMIKDNLQNG